MSLFGARERTQADWEAPVKSPDLKKEDLLGTRVSRERTAGGQGRLRQSELLEHQLRTTTQPFFGFLILGMVVLCINRKACSLSRRTLVAELSGAPCGIVQRASLKKMLSVNDSPGAEGSQSWSRGSRTAKQRRLTLALLLAFLPSTQDDTQFSASRPKTSHHGCCRQQQHISVGS